MSESQVESGISPKEGSGVEGVSVLQPSVWEYGVLTGVQIGKMRLLKPVELVPEKERISE